MGSCSRPVLGMGSTRSIPRTSRPRLPATRPLTTRAASIADAGTATQAGACATANNTPRCSTPTETTATRPDLPKAFEPTTAEQRIYEWWESQGYFAPNDDPNAPPFVMSMPPPNVTGRLHMGHAMFSTLEDIMVRYARMQGRAALWLPGTDHAGIATQVMRLLYGGAVG